MNPPALDLHSDKVRGIIATIVETVHPLRILVFGSVARGEAREHSDIDILVIMPPGAHRRRVGQQIDMALIGCDVPSDILVATEDDIRHYGDSPYMVYCDALRDGTEVYHAA